MSSERNLRQAIINERNRHLPDLGENATSLESIDLNKVLQTTATGSPFLYFDSGPESGDERILIFTTESNIDKFNDYATTMFLDGTFEIAPDIFYQVFTISGLFYSNLIN